MTLTTDRAGQSTRIRELLAASGTPRAELPHYVQVFARFADELRTEGQVAGGARSRAEAIHHFLHQRILRGPYAARGTHLGTTLDGGPYHCASASALFLALAAEFDLPALAVAVPGHVWCRVTALDESFDVETTCPRWFEILADGVAKNGDEAARMLADHQVRAASARVLDEAGLLALLHYNRGVRLFSEGQFLAAASSNAAALMLDPDCRVAYDNLLAAINNHALTLAADGDRRMALDLLSAGLILAPDYRPFHVNYQFISAKNSMSPAVGAF